MRPRAGSGAGLIACLSFASLLASATTPGRAAGDPPPAAKPPARRGIVLMTVDSLRTDRLGCYAGVEGLTPGVDGLARAGIRFERAYAASVSTAASVASLMTGLDPAGHGLRSDVHGRLEAAVPTLAERLRAGGWATAAVIGTDRLRTNRGLARGFERYDDDIQGIRGAVPLLSKERVASEVTERGLTVLEALPKERPFFLWLHFHDPYFDVPPLQKPPEPAAVLYKAQVAAVDAAVGAFVSNVRTRIPGGRVTFVLAGTHGEGLGDQKEIGHGFYLHETTVRVPFVVAPETPVAPAGRPEPAPVGLVDVAPTLLAIAGASPLDRTDGRVLDSIPGIAPGATPSAGRRKERKAGPSVGPRRVYMEAAAPFLEYGWSPLAGIVEGGRKVVVAPGGRIEAFDLSADASGSKPLPEAPPWAAELARDAAARMGHLEPTDERRRAVAAAIEGYAFPWENSPFCAEKATFPDPRDPERVALAAGLFLARQDAILGVSGRAKDIAEQVLQKDPANLTALEIVAIGALKVKRHDQLLEALEILTCSYPYATDGYHYLGHFHTQKGDLARALDAFRFMSVADPRDEEAHYDIACTLAALDRKDEALDHLRQAIDLGERDFAFMRRDGRLAPLHGDPRFAEMIAAAGG